MEEFKNYKSKAVRAEDLPAVNVGPLMAPAETLGNTEPRQEEKKDREAKEGEEIETVEEIERKDKKRSGFFVVHRQIMDSSIWDDPVLLKLYLYCIARANHEKRRVIIDNQVMVLERGQFISSVANIRKDYNNHKKKSLYLSIMAIRRKLSVLKAAHKLTIKATNKYSLISVVNYDFWQSERQTERPSKRPTKRQTSDKQATTDNNFNNFNNKEKNNKKEKNKSFLIENYLTDLSKSFFKDKPDFWKYKLTSPSKIEKVLASYYFFEGANFSDAWKFGEILRNDAEKHGKALEIIIKADYLDILEKMRNLRANNRLSLEALADAVQYNKPVKADIIADKLTVSSELSQRFSADA